MQSRSLQDKEKLQMAKSWHARGHMTNDVMDLCAHAQKARAMHDD